MNNNEKRTYTKEQLENIIKTVQEDSYALVDNNGVNVKHNFTPSEIIEYFDTVYGYTELIKS